MVDIRSSVGWVVDEHELTQVLPDVMKSACQVPEEARRGALAWLDAAVAERGGDVALAWRARNKKLGDVEDLLFYTRTRLVLQRAEDWVRAGRCPFWLEPTPDFAGVQTQGSRWVLTLEGGGRVTEELALGTVRWGGGGSGRLLVGYAFGERHLLSIGPEAGGDARFTNLELGQVNEFPQLVAFGALPIVYRYQLGLSAHAEVEAGPLAYVDEASADGTGRVSAVYYGGVRTGFAVGGTYLRLSRGVIPKFSVAVTTDIIPAVAGRPTLLQIGIGIRTGIDISRWSRF